MKNILIDCCPICQSKKVKFSFRAEDKNYKQTSETFSLYKCGDCNLLFINPMITEDWLHNLYPKNNYYAYNSFKANVRIKNGAVQKIKSFFIDSTPKDPDFSKIQEKSVLDIGCGSGEKLLYFKSKGWKEVIGVEIDSGACQLAEKMGLNVFNGTLFEAKFPDNKFDYIRSNHSFEHIIRNSECVAEMLRICKPGGKLFIGVPNTRSITFMLFKRNWFYLTAPYHPFGYNKKSLIKLLESKGFVVEKIRYNGNALGILGSIQLLLSPFLPKNISSKILFNKPIEILTYQLARIFNISKMGDCIEIISKKQ